MLRKSKKFQNWKVSEAGVIHKCGNTFKPWKIYKAYDNNPHFWVCECNIRRPPNHVRKLMKLIEFKLKLKGY